MQEELEPHTCVHKQNIKWQCRHHNHTLDRRHGIKVCLLWKPLLLRKQIMRICIENGLVCKCSYDSIWLSCDIFETCAKGTLENMQALFTCSGYPTVITMNSNPLRKRASKQSYIAREKWIQKSTTLPEKHGALHLDARVCVQGFPCKGLNFRLPLIFQCNCESLIFRISLLHLTLREDLEYVRVVTTVRHFRTMEWILWYLQFATKLSVQPSEEDTRKDLQITSTRMWACDG